ncbi:hypothetical protein BDZ91DRAFT_792991 [Kalaharituber pfeilii]|nr:hypothetical protein BDZ91DRAFT_792991 [Kalaharituber pfeilii]
MALDHSLLRTSRQYGKRPIPAFYGVYLLRSLPKPGSTYVGSTSDPHRRLLQHNGKLKGGAWKTKRSSGKYRPWDMVCIVSGFPSQMAALQFEWAWGYGYKTTKISQEDRQAIYGIASSGSKVAKKKKKPKRRAPHATLERRLYYLSALLRAQAFCRWPLHVRFFNADVWEKWEECTKRLKAFRGRPLGSSILIELSISPDKSYKRKRSTQLKQPSSHAVTELDVTYEHLQPQLQKTKELLSAATEEEPLQCLLCASDLRPPYDTVVVCPHACCEHISHVTCLGTEFLRQEPPAMLKSPKKSPRKSNNSSPKTIQLLPIQGICPGCNKSAKWIDYVKPLTYRLHNISTQVTTATRKRKVRQEPLGEEGDTTEAASEDPSNKPKRMKGRRKKSDNDVTEQSGEDITNRPKKARKSKKAVSKDDSAEEETGSATSKPKISRRRGKKESEESLATIIAKPSRDYKKKAQSEGNVEGEAPKPKRRVTRHAKSDTEEKEAPQPKRRATREAKSDTVEGEAPKPKRRVTRHAKSDTEEKEAPQPKRTATREAKSDTEEEKAPKPKRRVTGKVKSDAEEEEPPKPMRPRERISDDLVVIPEKQVKEGVAAKRGRSEKVDAIEGLEMEKTLEKPKRKSTKKVKTQAQLDNSSEEELEEKPGKLARRKKEAIPKRTTRRYSQRAMSVSDGESDSEDKLSITKRSAKRQTRSPTVHDRRKQVVTESLAEKESLDAEMEDAYEYQSSYASADGSGSSDMWHDPFYEHDLYDEEEHSLDGSDLDLCSMSSDSEGWNT